MKRAAQRTSFNCWENNQKEPEQFHFLDKIESHFIYSRTIPIRIASELNCREHWTQKSKRHSIQKMAVSSFLNVDRPDIKPPCIVKLIRIAPRAFDDDNMVGGFKYVKDAIAEYIHPNLAIGRADDDKRIKWLYAQEKGEPRQYAIRIEITKSLDC